MRLPLLDRLAARLPAMLAGLPAGVPFTLTLPLRLPVHPAGLAACEHGLLWQAPDTGLVRIALGMRRLGQASGASRLQALERRRASLQVRWHHLDPEGTGRLPAWPCGFAFDPDDPCGSRFGGLPNSLLAFPEVLVEEVGGAGWVHLSAPVRPSALEPLVERWLYRLRPLVDPGTLPCPPSPGSLPERPGRSEPEASWRRRVEAALEAIAAGRLQKVVLSRVAEVPLPVDFHLGTLLERLAAEPRGRVAYALRLGPYTLVGSTPERLVSLQHGRIQAEAVGGTTPRSPRPDEDARQATRLLQDTKLQHEHRLVVEDLRRRLSPWCERLVHPSTPAGLTLPDVRHLRTPIEARARPGVRLLELAAALHPTAATGGLPRAAALEWMRRHGEGGRGWYRGALGWMTPAGEGELAVVLRCGLIGQRRARLFAGAGIVAGSDPAEEYLETEWKLRTLARLLRDRPPGHRQAKNRS